jgi:hypothetical protein
MDRLDAYLRRMAANEARDEGGAPDGPGDDA